MIKEYIGTNKEDVKVWGVPFKKGTIVKVVIINDKHTFTYQDSLTGSLRGYDVQTQQINVHTKDDVYSIAAPQWGYLLNSDVNYIRQQNKNFKTACEELLAKMEIKK